MLYLFIDLLSYILSILILYNKFILISMSSSASSFKSQDLSKIEIKLFKNHKKTKNNLRVKSKITFEQFKDKIFPYFTKKDFILEIQRQPTIYQPITTQQQFKKILNDYENPIININTDAIQEKFRKFQVDISNTNSQLNESVTSREFNLQESLRELQDQSGNDINILDLRGNEEIPQVMGPFEQFNLSQLQTTSNRNHYFRNISHNFSALSRAYQHEMPSSQLQAQSMFTNHNLSNLQMTDSMPSMLSSYINEAYSSNLSHNNELGLLNQNVQENNLLIQELGNEQNMMMGSSFGNYNINSYSQQQILNIQRNNHMSYIPTPLFENGQVNKETHMGQNHQNLAEQVAQNVAIAKKQDQIEQIQQKDKDLLDEFNKIQQPPSLVLIPIPEPKIQENNEKQTALVSFEEQYTYENIPLQPPIPIPYVFERDPLEKLLKSQKKRTILQDKYLQQKIDVKEVQVNKFLDTNQKINLIQDFPYESGERIKEMLREILEITGRKVNYEMFQQYGPIIEEYKKINFRKKCYECKRFSYGPIFQCLLCQYEYLICSDCEFKMRSKDLRSHNSQSHPFAKLKRWHHLIDQKKVEIIDQIDVDQQALKNQRLMAQQFIYNHRIDREDYIQTFAEKITKSLVKLHQAEKAWIKNKQQQLEIQNGNKFQQIKQHEETTAQDLSSVPAVTDSFDLNISNIHDKSLNESVMAQANEINTLTVANIFTEIKLSQKEKKKKEQKLTRLQLKPHEIVRFMKGQFQNKSYSSVLQFMLKERKE